MSNDLQQAIAAIKAGDKETGQQLLQQVINADPQNEAAWLCGGGGGQEAPLPGASIGYQSRQWPSCARVATATAGKTLSAEGR